MASSNFLKKLRNRITKKKSYDIDTPCSAGHGTILLRRYDRVPSTYGDGHNDRQNVLRNFVPEVQKQSPGRFRGEVTLPRHFRLKSNHHRTQSNVTVVDHDEIDLYNAIGDHRRSSCSCTCTTPRKIMSPITPPNGTLHIPTQGTLTTTGTVGKCRNAAKDPLPPIVKAKREVEMEKEQERLKHEGKFDVPQEEVPRYTGIDDYSNVDFDSAPACDTTPPVLVPASTMVGPRSRHVESQQPIHRGCETLPPSSKSQAPRIQPSQTSKDAQPKKDPQDDRATKQRVTETAEKTPPAVKQGQSELEGKRQHQRRTEPGLLDVIDCYYISKDTSLQTSDLPIPHESCINKDRKASQPVQCGRADRGQDEPDGSSILSCSAPSGSISHCQSSLDDVCHSRHYPQNSGHHEYKEAHQVLRATSVGKIDTLDLEVSSSVEDLYAHVPKGTAKTPEMDDVESYASDPNTDNEDSLPPPPIPSRNYRSTDNCCSTAAQLGAGGCTCSHLKDMETGEELLEDGPQSVIHQQPRSTKETDEETGVKQVVEPIHMTLEEVWQDACARGIPMERPSTMTLQRRPKSSAVANNTETNSPHTSTEAKHPKDNAHKVTDTITDDSTLLPTSAAAIAAAKKKEKFKLKNIFKKTDHDSPSKSPTPGHRRTLSTSAVESTVVEDAHNCSDPLNTSGEMSSEMSESFGNTSNCSSADSGVDDVSGHTQNEPTRTINADFIDSLRKLKDCGWYWGPLSWDGAEARLDNKPDGSFLVRDSSDDRYILSISFRSQGTTHHTRIEHYKGTFSFFSQPKSHGAGTIIEFIEKAMEHSRSGKFLYFLRPRAPGFPPAPVQLLYPVSRFRVMQSLQHMCRFEILRNTRYDHIDRLPLPQKVKVYLKESQYYTEYILEYQGGDFMPL